MDKRRIKKDLVITWKVTTNGKPETLAGRDLTLFLRDPMGHQIRVEHFDIIEGCKIRFRYRGTEQKYKGIYTLTLWEYYGKIGQTATDTCEAFELVPTTCQENDSIDGLDNEILDLGSANIHVGFHGASAYEIAVSQGYKGSESEWLASLKGTDGLSSYQQWLLAGNEGTEDEFLQSLQGSDGLSAYQQWLLAGNVGTEEEFILSLKGKPGDPGRPGKNGADGGIIYPKFRITKGMHLMVSSVGPTDGRFKIDNGHLKLKV